MATFYQHIKEQYPDAGQWAQKYPWFGIGQFIAAMEQADTATFDEAAQKTAVFFNNAHRLHWLFLQQPVDVSSILAEYGFGEPSVATKTSEPELIEVPAMILQPQNVVEIEPSADLSTVEKEAVELEPLFDVQPAATDVQHAVLATLESKTEPEPAFDEAPIVLETEQAKPQPVFGKLNLEPIPFETDNEDAYDPDDTDGPEGSATQEDELVSIKDVADAPMENTAMANSLAEISQQFKHEPVDENAELVISTEPYYTVDYFASQGIKLENILKPDDKFGQQLKSFTNWLKHIKKLPPNRINEKEPDPGIEQIANTSLEEGEVVTESMAEVLLKQGKVDNAIEVWGKLSLLHPEKSVYFATLIEQFKV